MFVRIRKIIRKILRRPDIPTRQFRTPPTLNSNHPLLRPETSNRAASLPPRPAPPPAPPLPPTKRPLVNQPAPREDVDTSSDIIGALLIIEALKDISGRTPPVERPNPFYGFGGENGGAGANGDWGDTHEDDIKQSLDTDDTIFSYTSSSNDIDLSCEQDDSDSNTSDTTD